MRGLLLLLALLSGLITRPVYAAGVDPEAMTVKMEPGQTTHHLISFINDSLETENYVIDLSGVDFGTQAEDLRFEQLDTEHRGWLEISSTAFELSPGEEENIDVTITAPATAENQVFSFAVIATREQQDGSGVVINSGLASIVFVEVGGELKPSLSITAFETIPLRPRSLPFKFAALVQNSDDGLAQPRVVAVIKNLWGKEIQVLDLNSLGRRVPGHTSRVFSGEWQGNFWRFGPYTIDLIVTPDQNANSLTATASVVLFPWQLLVIVGAVVAALCAIVLAWLRARRH